MKLSYCTNVHPAETLDGIIADLDRYARVVRQKAAVPELGVGLWWPAAVAAELAGCTTARARLSDALVDADVRLRTVNAFPFAGFHAAVVKKDVYVPDWTDPRRLAFTLDCARALAAMLPPGADASISTLPLGWRVGWDGACDALATDALQALDAELETLAQETGVQVRVGIEPEPGCTLDTVQDVVDWLAHRPQLLERGRIGLCLDACHLAVSFADPAQVVAGVAAAGVPLVKVQASTAIELRDPTDGAGMAALAGFAEDRYLHQVRGEAADGSILRADDLPEVLHRGHRWAPGRWRTHLHVPLHQQPTAPLTATTQVLLDTVRAVESLPEAARVHLDIETYTWSVLPAIMRPADLADGIAAEVRWAQQHLMPLQVAS